MLCPVKVNFSLGFLFFFFRTCLLWSKRHHGRATALYSWSALVPGCFGWRSRCSWNWRRLKPWSTPGPSSANNRMDIKGDTCATFTQLQQTVTKRSNVHTTTASVTKPNNVHTTTATVTKPNNNVHATTATVTKPNNVHATTATNSYQDNVHATTATVTKPNKVHPTTATVTKTNNVHPTTATVKKPDNVHITTATYSHQAKRSSHNKRNKQSQSQTTFTQRQQQTATKPNSSNTRWNEYQNKESAQTVDHGEESYPAAPAGIRTQGWLFDHWAIPAPRLSNKVCAAPSSSGITILGTLWKIISNRLLVLSLPSSLL